MNSVDKVVIQIPCFNEEQALPKTLAALPREIPGVQHVEWLIIDDGSTDRTVEVARAHGVDHVIRHRENMGLARAFQTGLDSCLKVGADIIVNTDADNQYNAGDIPKLVGPILDGKADMVIGARPISQIKHFSPVKKLLQKIGSWVVRGASKTDIPDAPSGFRAISRDAAIKLNVFDEYTYTLETIIQAGRKGIAITSVPIQTNADVRPSRLVKGVPSYVGRSVFTILRVFMVYSPVRFFSWLGAIPFAVGLALIVRWLILYFGGEERAHVPSLVAAAICVLIGVHLWIMGLVADLLSANRKILEDVQERIRRIDVEPKRSGQGEEQRSKS